MLAEAREALREAKSIYSDPVEYAEQVFGLRCWSRQRELLRAVRDHDRVSARSGHKVSKSTSGALLAWWWTSDPIARPGARALLTSSSFDNLKRNLWREVRALPRLALAQGHPLGEEPALDPATGVRWPDGREIVGFSTRDAEKAAGTSGSWLLFILDEASGIEEVIFEALEGNRAGGGASVGTAAKILMLGNPTRTSGTFFDSHHSQRDGWYTLRISSEETPNVTGAEPPIPGLATREWIEEKRRDWGGPGQPIYDVRVAGNFPGQAENAVVGLALVDAAVERWTLDQFDTAEEILDLGLDVARFGDDESIVAPRRGYATAPLVVAPPGDGTQTAIAALRVARRLRRRGERPRVKVDSNGVGAAVFDALRLVVLVDPETGEEYRPSEEVEAIGINSAESSDSPEEYCNLRAQLHFGCRDWLKAGGTLPGDDRLQAELVAPVYSLDARNRLKVESKDELRKRLKRSPDRADALQLAVYEPPQDPRGPAVPPPPPAAPGRDLGAFAHR